MESSVGASQSGDSSTRKPALGPKPLLAPKPFSRQESTTVRSFRAPKTIVASTKPKDELIGKTNGTENLTPNVTVSTEVPSNNVSSAPTSAEVSASVQSSSAKGYTDVQLSTNEVLPQKNETLEPCAEATPLATEKLNPKVTVPDRVPSTNISTAPTSTKVPANVQPSAAEVSNSVHSSSASVSTNVQPSTNQVLPPKNETLESRAGVISPATEKLPPEVTVPATVPSTNISSAPTPAKVSTSVQPGSPKVSTYVQPSTNEVLPQKIEILEPCAEVTCPDTEKLTPESTVPAQVQSTDISPAPSSGKVPASVQISTNEVLPEKNEILKTCAAVTAPATEKAPQEKKPEPNVPATNDSIQAKLDAPQETIANSEPQDLDKKENGIKVPDTEKLESEKSKSAPDIDSTYTWGRTRKRLSVKLTSMFESGSPVLPCQPFGAFPPKPRSSGDSQKSTSPKPEQSQAPPEPLNTGADAEEPKEDYTGGHSLQRRISRLFDASSRVEVAPKIQDPEMISGEAVKKRIRTWTVDSGARRVEAEKKSQSTEMSQTKSVPPAISPAVNEVPRTLVEVPKESPVQNLNPFSPSEQSPEPQKETPKDAANIKTSPETPAEVSKSKEESPQDATTAKASSEISTEALESQEESLKQDANSKASSEISEEASESQDETLKDGTKIKAPADVSAVLPEFQEETPVDAGSSDTSPESSEQASKSQEKTPEQVANIEAPSKISVEVATPQEKTPEQVANIEAPFKVSKEVPTPQEETPADATDSNPSSEICKEVPEPCEETLEEITDNEVLSNNSAEESKLQEETPADVATIEDISAEESKSENEIPEHAANVGASEVSTEVSEEKKEATENHVQLPIESPATVQPAPEKQEEEPPPRKQLLARKKQRSVRFGTVVADDGRPPVALGSATESSTDEEKEDEDNTGDISAISVPVRRTAGMFERRSMQFRKQQEEERQRMELEKSQKEEEEARLKFEEEQRQKEENEKKKVKQIEALGLREEEAEKEKWQELERKQLEEKQMKAREEEDEKERQNERLRQIQVEEERKKDQPEDIGRQEVVEEENTEKQLSEEKETEEQTEREQVMQKQEEEERRKEKQVEDRLLQEELGRERLRVELEEKEKCRKMEEMKLRQKLEEEERQRQEAERKLLQEKAAEEERMKETAKLEEEKRIEEEKRKEIEVEKEEELQRKLQEAQEQPAEILEETLEAPGTAQAKVEFAEMKEGSPEEAGTQNLINLVFDNLPEPSETLRSPALNNFEPTENLIDIVYDDFSVRAPETEIAVEFDDFSVKKRRFGSNSKPEPTAGKYSWSSALEEMLDSVQIAPRESGDNQVQEAEESQASPDLEKQSRENIRLDLDETKETRTESGEEDQRSYVNVKIKEEQQKTISNEEEEDKETNNDDIEETDKSKEEIISCDTNDEEKDARPLTNADLHQQNGICEQTPETDRVTTEGVTTTDGQDNADLPQLPEGTTPLLDTSALKDRAALSRRRNRSRPSRSLNRKPELSVTDVSGMTETSEQMSSDSEEEQPKPSIVLQSPSYQRDRESGQKAADLIAELKKRSGVKVEEQEEKEEVEEDKESQSEDVAPSPSPKPSRVLAPPPGAFVLPPLRSGDGGSVESPAWMKELKTKKRMSQHESP